MQSSLATSPVLRGEHPAPPSPQELTGKAEMHTKPPMRKAWCITPASQVTNEEENSSFITLDILPYIDYSQENCLLQHGASSHLYHHTSKPSVSCLLKYHLFLLHKDGYISLRSRQDFEKDTDAAYFLNSLKLACARRWWLSPLVSVIDMPRLMGLALVICTIYLKLNNSERKKGKEILKLLPRRGKLKRQKRLSSLGIRLTSGSATWISQLRISFPGDWQVAFELLN